MAAPLRNIDHLAPNAICTGCHKSLPVSSFRTDTSKPRRRNTKCKECVAKVSGKRHAEQLAFRAEAISSDHKKACKNCGVVKLISDFGAHPNNQGGSLHKCKDCLLRQHKEWRDVNAEAVRRKARTTTRARRVVTPPEARAASVRKWMLKAKYGLTESAFKSMLESQNGKCAICRVSFSARKWGKSAANVDHDHETDAVRAILCTMCNTGLGCFQDKPTALKEAISYLEKHALKHKEGK